MQAGERQSGCNGVIDVKSDSRRIDIPSIISSHSNSDRGSGAVARGRNRRDFIVRQHASAKHDRVLCVRENARGRQQGKQSYNVQSFHRFPHALGYVGG